MVDGGEAAIAFSKQSSDADDIASIYRFKRITDKDDANYGKIDPDSIQELVLILDNGTFGNRTLIGFTLTVNMGYEYAIGKTTASISGHDAEFVYLKLGGTDNINGTVPDGTAPDGGDYRILKKIDFVEDFLTPEASGQIDWSKMIQHQSRFMITDGSHDGSAETGIYFDVVTVTGDGDPYEAVLYYNTSGFTLTQQFVGGKEYKEATGVDDFTARDSPTGNSS